MKTLVLFIALSLGSVSSLIAQGQIIFNNRITNILIAPVYNVEPANPSIRKQGNTTAGVPAGTQQYSGELLSGNSYTAQLFGGNTNTPVENLAALSPATTFRTNEGAGFIIAPPDAVTVPDVPENEPAKIVLRAWHNPGGITNWQQVLANPTIPRGESLRIISPPLGGVLTAPPNLIGLQSFNLALPNTSSPRLEFIRFHQTNGTFTAEFTAVTNRTYTIQASIDLTNWVAINTNLPVPASPWMFEDNEATSFTNRFYRLAFP